MMMNEPAGSPEWIDPDDAPILTEANAETVERFNGDVFVRRGRGRPKTGNAKELVSLRLDPDVLTRLRAAGPGWQAQVNALLRQVLGLGTVNNGGMVQLFSDSNFSEKTTAMTEMADEAVVSTEARVIEEVGMRKETTNRVETVRDTVRKVEVDIDQFSSTSSSQPGGYSGDGC